MGLAYDLHIHTALSPCADDDMTPATVVGLSKLAGLDILAVTDHNSAANLPAAKRAADHYGIKLLPGIEVNTAEEIHMLCYFPSVEAALSMSDMLYSKLPPVKADPEIWGSQRVLDENDNVLNTLEKLLTVSVGLDIYQVRERCMALGGVCIPAHADRDSYSILSVLGLFPEDLDFGAVELRHPGRYEEYVRRGLIPGGWEVFFSSDAHSMVQLDAHRCFELGQDSVLMPLIRLLG